jgi:hypothetical protein
VDRKKTICFILLFVFFYSLIIPLRLLFEWPLANYWDYSSHIAGTKVMLENGCNSIDNWTGYNICTKNAPGFFVVSGFFAMFLGVKTGFVSAVFFYILVFYLLATKVLKQDKLVALSVLGTPFAFWWFFKVGRVLEMTATLFAALFFMTDNKKLKVLFSALSIIHHPTLIIPLLLLSGKNAVYAAAGMLVVSPHLFFLVQNSGFVKWVQTASLTNFLNLLQAAPFVVFSPGIGNILALLFGESLLCSATGLCLVHFLPVIKNTYAASLAPLAVFLVFKKLSEKKKFKTLLLLTVLSLSVFFVREIYYLVKYGAPENLLPMEQNKAWLDENLYSVNGTFDYSCNKENYPTPMMASGYAYVNFGLDSVQSPFPEFLNAGRLAEVCDGCTLVC